MLVVGGVTSLWGAVLGALLVSGLDSFLSEAEEGVDVGVSLDLPQGTRLVFLGAIMALVLIVRPSGHHGRAGAPSAAGRPAAACGGGVRVCVVGCGAVGSLFAANLAQLDDVEVWAYDLDRGARARDQRARAAALGRGRGGRPAHARPPMPRSCRPATSASSRRRRCTRTPRRRHAPHAFADGCGRARFRTASATRRRSPSTSRA